MSDSISDALDTDEAEDESEELTLSGKHGVLILSYKNSSLNVLSWYSSGVIQNSFREFLNLHNIAICPFTGLDEIAVDIASQVWF